MNYYLTKKEVEELNLNHKHYIDLYVDGNPYKVGVIIYTHLTEVKNSTLFLDIYINSDWKKDNQETSILFVNQWLSKNEKLNQCKYYELAIYNTNSLGFVIHKNDNQDDVIKQIIDQYKPSKSESTLLDTLSNSKPKNLLKRLNNSFKPYPFATTIYKLQVELDLQFYLINLDSFLRLFTYDWEEYYYNKKYAGIPTVLRIERENDVIEFPDLEYSKLPYYSEYAVMTFKQTGFSFSTKEVLNIRGVELDSIKIYKFIKFKGSKLIAKAEKETLKEIKFI